MIDPVEILMATSSLLIPITSTATPIPLPTAIPDRPVTQHVEQAGKSTLWVVFFIMLISTLCFMVLAYRVPVQKRLFHVITTCITLFATLSYFAMATGDGSSYARIVTYETNQDIKIIIFRQIFWARYIDWSVTTPLLLLDLAFLAGLNGADIIVALVADVIMVLTGLFAAFGHSDIQKWGYYAMGCIAYIVIVWILARGRETAKANDAKTATFYGAIGLFTVVLWTLYPIVWGLGDGSRILSVDAEIIAYAILDVLAKPVFGFWLLITHARSNSAASTEGFWSHGLTSEGALRLDDDDGA